MTDHLPVKDETEIHELPKSSSADDVGLEYYLQAQDVEISEAENKRLLRKIDLHLMPLLMVTGFLQYLDKQALQYAVLYNLQPDLHLIGAQYSWANSIFYFGYVIWQYPTLLLMQRLPIAKYFASQVLLWGAVSFLMATCSNFGGIASLRFLLGCFESVQMPTFTLITGMYYTRKEQPFRFLLWYGMNGVAITTGGLFAYGVGHIHSPIPLWKFPFIICGALTVVWSVLLWFFLPSNPTTAWFLTHEERALVMKRVHENQTGIENKKFKPEQAWEALTDPKVLLNAVSAGAGNVLSGIAAFASLLIRGFGFTTLQTTLVQLPQGIVEIIALIIFTTAATYIPNARMTLGALASTIALIGAIVLYVLPLSNKWGLMVGFWLTTGIIPCGFILGLSTMAANVGGHTKKLTSQAIYFALYGVGSIIGPQLYKSSPYREGLLANVVALSIVVGVSFTTICYVIWENRKRRSYLAAHPELLESDYAYRDLTDKQNPFCFNQL